MFVFEKKTKQNKKHTEHSDNDATFNEAVWCVLYLLYLYIHVYTVIIGARRKAKKRHYVVKQLKVCVKRPTENKLSFWRQLALGV